MANGNKVLVKGLIDLMKALDNQVTHLQSMGFDNAHIEMADNITDATICVECSQCQVMIIQGVPCHETGCTNDRVGVECVECSTTMYVQPNQKHRRTYCNACYVDAINSLEPEDYYNG